MNKSKRASRLHALGDASSLEAAERPLREWHLPLDTKAARDGGGGGHVALGRSLVDADAKAIARQRLRQRHAP
eukprot:6198890-Pleurochrysis_carterae.AAC.1